MIAYNCWAISPAWCEQLAEGGCLVIPLEMGGYTRAIAFERRGEVLHARRFTYCGFVRDQGLQARPAAVAPLLDGTLTLRFDDGPAADTSGLEEALRGGRHEVATGVTMTAVNSYFGSLQLYAATAPSGFCRLAAHQDPAEAVTAIAKGRDAPAVLGKASLARPQRPARRSRPEGSPGRHARRRTARRRRPGQGTLPPGDPMAWGRRGAARAR